MIENKLIGWVRVAISRTRENINLKMQFLRNINFIILASSLSLLAALLVTKRLSSGIDSLIKVANEIQAGKFTARVNSVDNMSEIIILGNSLNQMLESLTQAQNEIKDLNENLEQKVKARTAELEASNKELESFSYSVSHDLRAPLRHISGYANLVIKNFSDNLPEKGNHYLTSIIESANQMGLLIDDLLQLSKTSRQELEYGKVDMNVIFLEVYENIKNHNKNRNIKWIISILPTVNGDFNLLKLVWFNLLANALKFTQEKSLAIIEVAFKEDDKEFIFSISDNGVGFDMQYSDKLFGVFQRLHSNKEFKGTGIGLANVYRIINRHGGRTWADAEVNKGATFYFTIPKKNKL
jgi:light-regulated signal transduction histidine kinase (bacteriophytochrome)